ncbi:MAG: prepilin-type N-terminal cleavage/methylation domain-containing protein [Phycisphaeraceae bacterium]
MNQKFPRPGFSLLELILVLAILSLGAALMAPSLIGFARQHEALDVASDMVALTQFAQDQAAQQGVPYRFNVDAAAQTYWLTVQKQGAFVPLTTDLGKTMTIPSRLTVTWEAVADASTEGVVEFQSDGLHEAACLRLMDENGNGARIVGVVTTEPFRVVELAANQEVR